MSVGTTIEWTDATFNPWWGCTKVSPGCDHCYAERDAHRFGTQWGPDAQRRVFGDKHWKEPLRWNERARKSGKPFRVFCASMADVFDVDAPEGQRERLWALIRATPHLTWQLLTKRIGNASRLLPDDWEYGYPNVWLGATVVNQDEADRDVPKLLALAARVRFLSCEPLLGPIVLRPDPWCTAAASITTQRGNIRCGTRWNVLRYVDWVIVGGESGPNARPMHPEWAQDIRDQCAARSVAFLFKQWGEWAPHSPRAGGDLGADVRAGRVQIVHPTGEDDVQISQRTGGYSTIPGSRYMARVGKKAAGRILNGRIWEQYP